MNKLDHVRARLFDLAHNVETRTRVPLAEVDVVGNNKSLGHMYVPTLPRSMRKLFEHLQPMGPATTYIDIGSGKGLTLLVASQFPFRKIVGVEFSPQLAEAARQNAKSYFGTKRCANIDVLCMDAAEFVFPRGPLMVYLFNPFEKQIMARVLSNLAASAQSEQQNVTLICDKLHDRALVEKHLAPARIDEFLGFSIYSQLQPANLRNAA